MKTKLLALVAILALSAAVLITESRKKSAESGAISSREESLEAPIADSTPVEADPSVIAPEALDAGVEPETFQQQDDLPARRTAPIADAAPQPETLREEAAANPHVTPGSLLTFAALMGERMESAMASEDEAKKLFPELESCVLDNAGRQTPQVRLVCLVNAHRLAGRHHSLAGPFGELSRKDPSLARMMEMTGLSEME